MAAGRTRRSDITHASPSPSYNGTHLNGRGLCGRGRVPLRDDLRRATEARVDEQCARVLQECRTGRVRAELLQRPPARHGCCGREEEEARGPAALVRHGERRRELGDAARAELQRKGRGG